MVIDLKTIFITLTLLLMLLGGCSNEKVTENDANQNSSYEAQRQLANTTDAPEEIGHFATTIYTKTDERQNNVQICCNELNGSIVEENETFSFCDTLRSC